MSAEEVGEEPPPASAWRLLRDAAFARYFLGNLVSNIGSWFQDIAAAILIFQLTGSAVMVGGVAIAGFATSLVLAPVGGQLADRFDRRKLLIVTHVVQMLAASTLAIGVAVGTAEVWAIFAVGGVLGIGRAINTPTLHAILPSLVAVADLAPASALQAVTFNLARAVGPLLGALVVTHGGGAAAFAVNAASFGVFAVLLTTIRVRPFDPAPGEGGGGILAGVRHVQARPRLLMLLVATAVIGMATDPVLTLGPSFAAAYDQPPAYAGWLVSAFGAGSIAGAPLIGVIRRAIGREWTGVFGLAGAGAGLAVLGIVQSPIAALIGAGIAGFFFITGSTDLTTSLQELLHDSVRGRVMALWTMAFLGSRPLAALLDGTIADVASPWVAVLFIAAVLAFTAVGIGLWSRRLGASDPLAYG